MHPSFVPPRCVMIGDAAWFAETTPRAIRHYEQIGLMPAPERGSDGRQRYTQGAILRLLWVRKMAEAGIALDDIHRAFEDPAGTAQGEQALAEVLARLAADLEAQEEALRQKRDAVERMRRRGASAGLLDDLVAEQLSGLPDGLLRQRHLDKLLVTQRVLGPLGAAIQAGRYTALASRPDMMNESDRLDAAEEALDDSIPVDDPRVIRTATERHAFETALQALMDTPEQLQKDNAHFEAWEGSHVEQVPDADERHHSRRVGRVSAFEAMRKMPYEFSPARIRCMELTAELAAQQAASQ